MKKKTGIRKKVVVTGGAGFIGSHLVRALISGGYEVSVIDNCSTGKKENIPAGVTFVLGDVCDTEVLRRVMQGATYVFHLAAMWQVQYSMDYPQEANTINTTGTLSVLCAAKDVGVKRVIFASSCATYGDIDTMPLIESIELQPKSPYGLQKYFGELYCQLFSRLHNLETVSLRYFNVYGSGANPDVSYPLVTTRFIEMRRRGEPMTITGDGSQTRDYVHVADVVRGTLLAAESNNVGKGEVVNIGGGRSFSVKQIAEIIGGPIKYIPSRIEPHDARADISLAKKLFGWEPTIRLEEGIVELKKIANLK